MCCFVANRRACSRSISGLRLKRPARLTGTTNMRKRKMQMNGIQMNRFHLVGVVVVGIAAVAVFMLWRAQGTGLEEARAARVSSLADGPRVQVVAVTQGP